MNSAGKPILLYTIPRTMNMGVTLFFSSSELVHGSYTIEKGGTIGNESGQCNSWWDNCSWSGDSNMTSFSVSSTNTTLGNSMGGDGQMGGGPGTGMGGWWRP